MPKQSKLLKGDAKNQFSKNWLNIMSLLIAISALVLSYQANQISRESSSSSMRIVGETFSKDSVMVTGCRTENNSYFLEFYVANEFTIANVGGRTTSLVGVRLRGDEDYLVKVFPPQSFEMESIEPGVEPDIDKYHGFVFGEGGWNTIIVPTDVTPIREPLLLESGASHKWMFQGERIQIHDNVEDLETEFDDLQNGMDTIEWVFEFSDGSTIVKPMEIVSVSINPNLTSADPPPCKR